MNNSQSPQSFAFIYEEMGEQKHAVLFAENIKEAYKLWYDTIFTPVTDKTGREPKLVNIYQELPREEDPWERNVQFMRVEFPRLLDAKQDEEAALLAEVITNYLQQRFVDWDGVVSLGGFYRGDHDWDNIDTPDACINHPNRGEGENEP